MIYTIIILFAFSVVLLLKKYTNRYSITLSAMAAFLNISLLASTIYLAKVGNYSYSGLKIVSFDYKGFILLSRLKISFYTIIRMQNIGFGGYLICMPFFLHDYNTNRRVFLRTMTISLILPILYIIFYDPEIKQIMYLNLYSGSSENFERLANVIKTVDRLNYIWISVYLLCPIVMLVNLIYKANTNVKKKQLLSLAVSVLSLNLLYGYSFIAGPFCQTLNNVTVEALLGFNTDAVKRSYQYNLLPLITLFILYTLILVLFKFHGVDNIDFFKNYMISKGVKRPDKNIKNILHTYKNEMISVNVVAKQLALATDDVEKQRLVERIEELSQNSIENISGVMKMMKRETTVITYCDVSSCMDAALKKIEIGPDISVNRNYTENNFAYCEPHCLEACLVNILTNAVEALKLSCKKNKKIDVSISGEYDWLNIEITDNGPGISKKNIKHIFKAFYSTKASSKNWGIGLNYVYRSIKAMHGLIFTESTEGEYTKFQIMLQLKNVKKR